MHLFYDEHAYNKKKKSIIKMFLKSEKIGREKKGGVGKSVQGEITTLILKRKSFIKRNKILKRK